MDPYVSLEWAVSLAKYGGTPLGHPSWQLEKGFQEGFPTFGKPNCPFVRPVSSINIEVRFGDPMCNFMPIGIEPL